MLLVVCIRPSVPLWRIETL